MWMTRTLPGIGIVHLSVVCMSVLLPTNSTVSARETISLALLREWMPLHPTARGCVSLMEPFPKRLVATGIVRYSASAISSFQACAWTTPPPATMTGFSDSRSSLAAFFSLSGSGQVRSAG